MPAFDLRRPPEQEVIDDCVHCGFCLDACPTYALWGMEADSPRGRIVLIADGLEPDAEMSDELVTHLDRCLGCMACVTACPSGVKYDRLIERARPQVERHHRRPVAERALRRLLYETLPHPARLRLVKPLIGLGRRPRIRALTPPPLRTLTDVAPRASGGAAPSLPERTAAIGEQRGRVGLLLGCVQRVFYPEVHRATIAVLAAEGFEVLAPRQPGCCGALELHGGAEDAAIGRARQTVEAFAALGVDRIVVNAAGCGSAMKGYGELLGDERARSFSAKVCDITELLGVDHAARSPRGRCRSASCITTPAISRTPRGSANRRVSCCARSPSSSCSRSPPSRGCAAARPGSTTSSNRRQPPSWASAKPATCWRPAPR